MSYFAGKYQPIIFNLSQNRTQEQKSIILTRPHTQMVCSYLSRHACHFFLSFFLSFVCFSLSFHLAVHFLSSYLSASQQNLCDKSCKLLRELWSDCARRRIQEFREIWCRERDRRYRAPAPKSPKVRWKWSNFWPGNHFNP